MPKRPTLRPLITKKKLKKLTGVVEIHPPENCLEYYMELMARTDHAQLNPTQQHAAVGILKILQALN